MTLGEARTDLLNQSALDIDLYVGQTLDEEGNAIEEAEGLTMLISRACVWWAKMTHCCYSPSVSLVLTIGTDRYSCRDRDLVSAKVLKPRVVVINDTPLRRRDGKRHGLWTMEELQYCYPNWRTDADGVPTAAIWLPTNELMLYKAPESAYTGKNFIEAWTIPDDLDAAADEDNELPVPEEDHPAIVRLAQVFGSLPNLSDGEAWQRASTTDSWWREQAERRNRENVTAFLGRKPRGERAREWMYGA